jgi:hypothetical protein
MGVPRDTLRRKFKFPALHSSTINDWRICHCLARTISVKRSVALCVYIMSEAEEVTIL